MTQLGKGRAAAMTDAEMAALADELVCHPANLEAIAEVESSGFGWFRDGRIKILFEKHWFYKLVDRARRDQAVSAGLARRSWVSPANGGYKDQKGAAARYRLLEAAMRLDRDAGLQSISIGRFQIMGFNHEICGFDTVEEMWTAFLDSEKHQLRAFANFLKSKNLVAAVRRGDFATVEEGYNGGGLNGRYARRMKKASDKLRAGKWKGYVPGSLRVEPEPEPEPAPVPAPRPEPKPDAKPPPPISDGDGRPNWTPDEDRDPDEVGGPMSGGEKASTGTAGGAAVIGGTFLANGQWKAALAFFVITAIGVGMFLLIRHFRKWRSS